MDALGGAKLRSGEILTQFEPSEKPNVESRLAGVHSFRIAFSASARQ
jgi:hypothetical protein